jgi:hypothetical protein
MSLTWWNCNLYPCADVSKEKNVWMDWKWLEPGVTTLKARLDWREQWLAGFFGQKMRWNNKGWSQNVLKCWIYPNNDVTILVGKARINMDQPWDFCVFPTFQANLYSHMVFNHTESMALANKSTVWRFHHSLPLVIATCCYATYKWAIASIANFWMVGG